MSIQFRILLSRFLTRFGDQAWDFATPLILIHIFPGKMQVIAMIYLFSKLAQILIGPKLSQRIDNNQRLSIYKLGIGSQTIAMLFIWLLTVSLFISQTEGITLSLPQLTIALVALASFSAVSNLGSSLMDISVGFDLAVDLLPESELALFNSRLKRLDLITEVTAPIFTGVMFSIFESGAENKGFTIVAILNLLTFLPEYLLLRSTQQTKDYIEKVTITKSSPNFLKTFIESLKKLKGKPYSLIIISYAFLWLSALSPHGVLLTSFLKDGTEINEMTIGIFRGMGALFGLIPTFLFSHLRNKCGLVTTSRYFLSFQFLCVLGCTIVFLAGGHIYLFLGLILFSRIGLYGFSIGETELRQILIPKDKRGEVNGIANSTTSMATLVLFLAATLFGNTEDFGKIVTFSALAVLISMTLYLKFIFDLKNKKLEDSL